MTLALPRLEVVTSPGDSPIYCSAKLAVCWIPDASDEVLLLLEDAVKGGSYANHRVVLFAYISRTSTLRSLGLGVLLPAPLVAPADAEAVLLGAQRLKESLKRAAGLDVDIIVDQHSADLTDAFAKCTTKAQSVVFLIPVATSLRSTNRISRLFTTTWEERVMFAVHASRKGAAIAFLRKKIDHSPILPLQPTGAVVIAVLDLSQFLPTHEAPQIARCAMDHSGPNDRLIVCGTYALPPIMDIGLPEVRGQDWSEGATLAKTAASETLSATCRLMEHARGKGCSFTVERGPLVACGSLLDTFLQVRSSLPNSVHIRSVIVPRATSVILSEWMLAQKRWFRRDATCHFIVCEEMQGIDVIVV
jgi:hypothetical protein